MQSTNECTPDFSLKQVALPARRCTRATAASRAAMTGMAGLAALVVLFCASLAYVVLGGAFATDASPLAQAEIPVAAVAMKTADAGAAGRIESVPGYSVSAADGGPRPDADGIVRRYEDD